MNKSERHIFYGMQILHEDKWKSQCAVIVEKGVIKAIIPQEMIQHHQPAELHEYPSDYLLVPGFIDVHIHGAAGADVMDASPEALAAIAQMLAAEGVTGFLATTMTASSDTLTEVMHAIAQYSKKSAVQGAALLGVHLEGPFIAKEKMGAQSPAHIVKPDIDLVERWQQAADGLIKLITLAPELPDMIPFIKKLKKMDIRCSVGHTNATYAETGAAIEAGCSQGTHLFNAMRGLHQREPGAAAALLLAQEVAVELIADGLHVHPAMLSLALQVKGRQEILLVTDAMRAKCCGDGRYELGGQEVTVKQGKAMLAGDVLAGSTLLMPEAIKNMAEFTGCSLIDAIQMASYNPAMRLGLSDRKGQIAIGYDADMVMLDAALNVKLTLLGGVDIYKAKE